MKGFRKDEVLPRRQQIQMDSQALVRLIALMKEKGSKRDDLTNLVMALAEKKDQFREFVQGGYEQPLDVPPEDKRILKALYDELGGAQWRDTFGWNGQVKTSNNPEVGYMECEAQIYHGLKTRRLWVGDDDSTVPITVTGMDLAANSVMGSLPEGLCLLKAMKVSAAPNPRTSLVLQYDIEFSSYDVTPNLTHPDPTLRDSTCACGGTAFLELYLPCTLISNFLKR